MENYSERQRIWTRLFMVVLAIGLLVCWAGQEARASSEAPVKQETEGFFGFLIEVSSHIFDSRALMRILGRPEYTIAAFLILNLIVFVETGLLIGFFLPGDSLLVSAGLVCAGSGWSLPLLLGTLCLSAIVGDSVGYAIGWHTGPKIFCREKSFFFDKDHLLKAQQFYERHGGKTIILARFMPFIRTFAPVVAGVGKMNYGKFLFFNIFGGIGWVVSMILAGFYLPRALKPVFGPEIQIQDHIEKVIIVVVLLSISPGIFMWLRGKLKGKAEPQAELVEAEKV